MNIYSLTFRDLQYLVALAEFRHFGKAAKSCFVSQPALSSQIKKIEGYFDKTLFERQNKNIFLTPEGVKVVDSVKLLLEDAKKLEELFQVKKNLLSSTLSVGLIQTLSPYYPPFFLKKLKEKYPLLNLTLVDGFTENLLEDLKSGKLDILIASAVFSDSKINTFHLFQEPLYLGVNSEHEFANKPSLSLNDLNAEDMLFLKDGNCLKDEAIDLCPKNRRGNINDIQISNLESLKQMIAYNKCYGIIPAMAADIPSQLQKMMVIKKFKDQNKAYRQISMFIRKDAPRLNDYIAFLEVLEGSNRF
ncbi:MAG: LysR substrate-binding domain-containing protein [Bdellovibrionota bacterium]